MCRSLAGQHCVMSRLQTLQSRIHKRSSAVPCLREGSLGTEHLLSNVALGVLIDL